MKHRIVKLAQAVDVMMTQAKRIYILIIKVQKLCSFFHLFIELKEIENMFSVFLSSHRNTRESLGELEKAEETLTCDFNYVPTAFLVLPHFHSCFSYSIETQCLFSIS